MDFENNKFYKEFEEKYRIKVEPKLVNLENTRLAQLARQDYNNIRFSEIVKKHCLNDLLDCLGIIAQGAEPSYSVYATGLVQFSRDRNNYITKINREFHGTYENVKFNVTEISNCSIKDQNSMLHYRNSGVSINLQFERNLNAEVIVKSQVEQSKIPTTIVLIALICTAGLLCSWVCLSTFKWGIKNFDDLIGFFVWFFWWCVTFVLPISYLIYIYTQKDEREYLDSEKRFFIQPEDYKYSKQILTPEFIEKLNNLRKTLGCSGNTWCKFQDNQITMFFNTPHSMFEIGNLNKPMSGLNQITLFLKDLKAITDIIDYFKKQT